MVQHQGAGLVSKLQGCTSQQFTIVRFALVPNQIPKFVEIY